MGVCAAIAVAQDLEISVEEPCSLFQDFFDLQMKHANEETPHMMDMFAMMKDPALMQKTEDEMQKKQEKFEADLKLIIEKCFDHYDTSKSQSLGPKVCSDLFTHYVDKQSRLLVDMQEQKEKQMTEEGSDVFARMMGPMPPIMGSHEGQKKEVMAKMDEHFAQSRRIMEGQVSEYQADKARRDAAALEVLDINGDGKLQRSEVVEGLLPSTAKNRALMTAFGLNPESLPKFCVYKAMTADRRKKKPSVSPDKDNCKQQWG